MPTTVLLYENFANGIPGSWTVIHGGSGRGGNPDATWNADLPAYHPILVPPYAIADSDRLGSGQTMDEQLITAAVGPWNYPHVTLDFDHKFKYWADGLAEKADVDVRSLATVHTWVNVARFSGADAAGHVSIDLTPYVSSPSLEIRFHYYDAQYEWYWAVDDVTIRGNQGQVCSGPAIFRDGFESGNTAAWASTVP